MILRVTPFGIHHYKVSAHEASIGLEELGHQPIWVWALIGTMAS